MSLVRSQQGLGKTHNITLFDVDNNVIIPGINDEVRIHIARRCDEPVLTVASNAPTTNGSTLTKGEINVLRLDADDLDFSPGTYTMFIEFFDNADAQEWKDVDQEVFVLGPSYVEVP